MTHINGMIPTMRELRLAALMLEYENKPAEKKSDALAAAQAMQKVIGQVTGHEGRSMSAPRGKRSTDTRGAPVATNIAPETAPTSDTVRETPPLVHDVSMPRTTPATPEAKTNRVLELARSVGIYSGDPEPEQLTDAQRRAIEREFALKMTEDIDWKKALGPDATNPATVYYDGLTLRNATNLSIAQAAAAIERRISAMLDRHPENSFDYLMRPMRDDLIGDPTISLHSPPTTIRYGSHDWARLWDGIQQAKRRDLDPVGMQAADLIRLSSIPPLGNPSLMPQSGHPVTIEGSAIVAKPDATLSAEMFGGLVRMANAAGELKLPETGKANEDDITNQLSAYAPKIYGRQIIQQWNYRKASTGYLIMKQGWIPSRVLDR